METTLEELISTVDEKTRNYFKRVTHQAAQNAGNGFSRMAGKDCVVLGSSIHVLNLFDVSEWLGLPEDEVVTIYLQVWDELPFQLVLMCPRQQAFDLIDMILEQPQGTTRELDEMGQSVLAELGNLTGSYFLNGLSSETRVNLMPSPPGVMVDMLGAIMSVIVATADDCSQQVVVIKTGFEFPEEGTRIDFWIIPALESVESLLTGGRNCDE